MGVLGAAARLVPRAASHAAGLASGTARLTAGTAAEAAGLASGLVAGLASGAIATTAVLATGAVSRTAGLASAGFTGVPRPRVPHPPRSRLEELVDRAELGNLIGPRTRRRVWAREGRAYIELRGHPAARTKAGAELREAATEAVRRLKGVRWAEVNAVTGEVLCAFDEDRIGLDAVLDAVAAVEEAHRVTGEAFPMEKGHPADLAPVTAEAIAMASDCAAFALAAMGRFARLPRLPRSTRVAVAWVDGQPRMRRRLEARLGPHGTDLVLAVSSAVLHALTQEPSALAVNAVGHGVQLSELKARRDAWCRWEADLAVAGLPTEAPHRHDRPAPLPPGPVETCADRSAMAALAGAAGVAALGRAPGAAADLLLAMVPRAAHTGRAGFAAGLGRGLARDGVVPMDGRCYRRLDRVTAVVVDSAALCGPEAEIISADGSEAWRAASRLLEVDPGLEGVPDADGWRLERTRGAVGTPADSGGLRLRVLRPDGTALGEALVGRRLDPLAESLLVAARDGGARVLLTQHVSTADLLPLADDALEVSTPLLEHVRALQRDGEGVLVVTAADQAAALAADVAVGVQAAVPAASNTPGG